MEIDVPGLDPGEVRELTVHVRTGVDVTFTGRVLSEDGGLPVVGVAVGLEYSSGRVTLSRGGVRFWPPDVRAAAVTDADEFFTVQGRSWSMTVARLRRGARISSVIHGTRGADFKVEASAPGYGLVDGPDTFETSSGDVLFQTQVDSNGRVGRIAKLNVGSGEQFTDLRMQLEQGGTLLVHYSGSGDAAQLRILQDGVVFFAGGLYGGTQARAVVPTGQVEVHLGEEHREVFISVGEETAIRFGEAE